MNSNKPRIMALDTLRGILILLVIWFHISYDLNYIFGVRLNYMYQHGTYVFRDVFVGMLILISGICCNLTHSNIGRGAKTLGWGVVITVVTAVAMPEELIIFGILHFFGTSMIIYGIFEWCMGKIGIKENRIRRMSCAFIGIIFAILFFLTWNWYEMDVLELLGDWWQNSWWRYPLFFLGFDTGCNSADYYPLIPWSFLFLAGAFVTVDIKKMNLPKWFYIDYCPVITWIGQRTLWIYLLHQPLVYGVLYLWFVVLH